MKLVIINIFYMSTIVFGQTPEQKHPHCLVITAYVNNNIDSLNNDSLLVFFKQFSSQENKNAAEFREWGNETLFNILQKNPTQFFNNLFSLDSSEIKCIESEINSPIHDSINMIKVYKEVENSKLDKENKNRALNFIRPSYETFKKLIEDWEKKNNKKWEY